MSDEMENARTYQASLVKRLNHIAKGNTHLKEALKHQAGLFQKLDEAMATPERIETDTRLVGGFVSSLDLTETADQIVDRAIAILNSTNP